MIATLGAFSQSIAVATSYATLGMSAVAEAINETEAVAVVCNINNVTKLAAYCKDKCKSLTTIIYTTNYSTEKKHAPLEGSSLKLYSVDEVIELGGKDGQAVKFAPPTPEHLAVIMYTSGSTGKPKGVMIPHKSMVASVAALRTKFFDFGFVEGQEVYLAYLPAAHILELIAEMSMFCLGASVGFACPKTISSKGACRERPDGSLSTKPDLEYAPGAIQEFKPTVMAAVPKIWDILKKGVEEVVGKGSPVAQFLFQAAYSARYFATMQGRESPLFKAVVFKKLVNMLGGRLKGGITGGGPISADVQGFIRTAFCMPLLQGYALTETSCAGAVQEFSDVRFGVVGPPVGSVEIKLRSCLDDKSQPEVLDRKHKPYFDKDGWFHTGDVALFTPDGALMIVDRLKNLVKLKGGEYIAIEAMEKEYSSSAYVNGQNGGVMCYGDGEMDRPVALVQANTVELEKWAKEAGVKYANVDELCANPQAEKAVLDSILIAGKQGDLAAN